MKLKHRPIDQAFKRVFQCQIRLLNLQHLEYLKHQHPKALALMMTGVSFKQGLGAIKKPAFECWFFYI